MLIAYLFSNQHITQHISICFTLANQSRLSNQWIKMQIISRPVRPALWPSMVVCFSQITRILEFLRRHWELQWSKSAIQSWCGGNFIWGRKQQLWPVSDPPEGHTSWDCLPNIKSPFKAHATFFTIYPRYGKIKFSDKKYYLRCHLVDDSCCKPSPCMTLFTFCTAPFWLCGQGKNMQCVLEI